MYTTAYYLLLLLSCLAAPLPCTAEDQQHASVALSTAYPAGPTPSILADKEAPPSQSEEQARHLPCLRQALVPGARRDLFLAARRGDVQLLTELLLDVGVCVDLTDPYGWTPLHWAVFNSHEPVVRLLLETGASVDPADHNGCTPLHTAATHGDAKIAGLLLEKGAQANPTDQLGWTPLHCAADEGHEQVAQRLLQQGAEVNPVNAQGQTPLSLALRNGHRPLAALLIASGASMRRMDALRWHLANQQAPGRRVGTHATHAAPAA